jgi:hypothetical protein
MTSTDRPEGNDEVEGGEDETVIDEDDFADPLNQTVDELDEVKKVSMRRTRTTHTEGGKDRQMNCAHTENLIS